MVMVSRGGSGGGLELVYYSQSIATDQINLSKPVKIAILTCNVLEKSGAVMVVPGQSQNFGNLSGNNRTVSMSSDGMTITKPAATTMTCAVFG